VRHHFLVETNKATLTKIKITVTFGWNRTGKHEKPNLPELQNKNITKLNNKIFTVKKKNKNVYDSSEERGRVPHTTGGLAQKKNQTNG